MKSEIMGMKSAVVGTIGFSLLPFPAEIAVPLNHHQLLKKTLFDQQGNKIGVSVTIRGGMEGVVPFS